MKNEVIFNNSYSGYEGAYILASNKINCRQYWTQHGGNLAIWNDKTFSDWQLGSINDLGKAIGPMYGVGNYSVCPINTEWRVVVKCSDDGTCTYDHSSDLRAESSLIDFVKTDFAK